MTKPFGRNVGSLYSRILDDIQSAVAKAIGIPVDPDSLLFETPPSSAMGDLAVPCFGLAKAQKKSPAEVAKDLAGRLASTTYVERWAAAGPYLNIFLQRLKVSSELLKEVEEKHFGRGTLSKNEKVMLEYVSPNTNKPLHLGHIRNGLIGWSVAELLKTQGAKVLKSQITNDRGIHIIKSMLAYQKWGEGATPESAGTKGDHFVGEWYVRFEKEFQSGKAEWLSKVKEKKNAGEAWPEPQLLGEAREMLRKWESGDKAVRALWKKMNMWVYEGFALTFMTLGLDFDHQDFESQVYQEGKEIIEEALKKGVFKKADNGAIVAPLEASGLPDKVVLRADGTGLYVTQDLSLAIKRFKKFHLDQLLYCVGSEQDLYFRQLFAILRLLGYPFAEKVTHLSYGLVFLPEGKMKSREGTVVDADDLLKTMFELAHTELSKRYPNLPEEERSKRARAIGLAALKFQFLLVGNVSPIHFDPKASISFEGKTGPYLQYSYARAASILRKAKKVTTTTTAPTIEEGEWALLSGLLRYPEVIAEAARKLDPSSVANELLEIAQRFHSFYHAYQVLEAPSELREFRLSLVQGFCRVMKDGLALLGIATLEEM